MITVTDKDLEYLVRDLSIALVKLSTGKLDTNLSEKLAKIAIMKIDFSNWALADKGVNWYAKEIISCIDFEALADTN